MRRLRHRHRQGRSRTRHLELRSRRRHGLPGGHVGHGGILAQLQGADIGHDAPAIARRNLRSIVGHNAVTIGHDVEEIPQRHFAQALGVIGRRLARKTARRHRSVAIAQARVAGRAIDVEALAAALQNLVPLPETACSRRDCCQSSRYRSRCRRATLRAPPCLPLGPLRAQIAVEIALGQGLEARLVVHILAATGQRQHHQQSQRRNSRRLSMILAGHLRNGASAAAPPEISAWPRRRTWGRKKTRSGKTGLWWQRRNAAR